MCRKLFFVLLLGVISFLSSCIDKTYDLANKEISTDVKIESNTVALPVGSLKPIVLDSLVDVSQIEMLEIDSAGVYSITMDSVISIEEKIDSIILDIEPLEYDASINFDKVNIKNVHIKAENLKPAKFSAPKIKIEDLNNYLPKLTSRVKPKLGVDDILESLEQYPGDLYTYTFPQALVSTTEQYVDCSIKYEFSTDIDTIKSIKLGSQNDPKGTLVSVVVKNPRALKDNENCQREINFSIEFPEIFQLAKNENDKQKEQYTLVNDHSISFNGSVPSDDETLLSFYITDVVGIDEYIKDGRIDIADSIKYSIDYKLDGTIELTKDMTADDFVFEVELDAQLSLTEVAGKTKDVKVAFEPIEMKFDGEFDNLQHIDTIYYVEFNDTLSRIKFETRMDDSWLGAFELKDGYALKISFPEFLEITPELSQYEGEYKEDEHAFYVYDFKDLTSSHWELALKKLELNLFVDKEQEKCHMVETATAEIVNLNNPDEKGCFYLDGRPIDNMIEVLGNLGEGDKEVYFSLLESDLVIKNAAVHTEVIHSSLNAETTFKINEKIPAEIELINGIGFEEPVQVAMALNVAGLESLDTNIDLDVNISLPPYLKLQPCDQTGEVKIDNGVLNIKKHYNPSTGAPLELKLLCSGIDFANEGLSPKDSTDGNRYISHESEIVVRGDASINGAEFHSMVLDNDISLNINFDIEKIVVKTFHGIYCAELEGVSEKIGLELGEELEFLKNPENSITLAEPQLELVLKNPVGIPVDVDLHLFGTDEAGAMIAESEIATTVSILPAEYDEEKDKLIPVETKLFITSDTSKHKKAGYNNIEIENLSNLLKTFPDSLNLVVEPIIRTNSTHHVNISEPIKLDAAYSVVVPLKFNDFNLCYSDTITGLKGSIDETLEMFSNVALKVKMDVLNTIPLGLSLKVVPLDENGEVIADIEIDELLVGAGSGEALIDENGAVNSSLSPQKFVFAIKSKSGDISSLDQLALSLVAATDHVTGSEALKGEQGIKISNIVFEVSGDIEMDFGK